MRRLDFLVALGVAQRIGTGTWEISPDLERTLRQPQLAGDILKSRVRHQAHVSDPRMPLVVTRIGGCDWPGDARPPNFALVLPRIALLSHVGNFPYPDNVV
jgi:hypothetical protein